MNFSYNIKLKPKSFSSKKAIYLIPPTDEEELKCVLIDVLLNEEIKAPTDTFSIFRLIKHIFRQVEYSVYTLSRLRLNNIIRELALIEALKITECYIGTKKTFLIQSVSLTKLKAIKNGMHDFFNTSESFDKKRFEEKARKIMYSFLEEKYFQPDPDDFLYANNYKTRRTDKKVEGNQYLSSSESSELDFDDQQLLNRLFFEPSALTKLQTKQVEAKQVSKEVAAIKAECSSNMRPFCEWGTKTECVKNNRKGDNCKAVHFTPIIKPHTDKREGDCCYLDTCKQMETCKYVHYSIEDELGSKSNRKELVLSSIDGKLPSQWLNCDIRSFDFDVLGKFDVIMADPPWDIHMDLPYGTLSDDEMKFLKVKNLQDEGVIFLWVTGRATELGRECLELWGYRNVEELVWVKTNQLQRLIRTGRTGHWLNHSKEHCLVGIKGNPKLNNNIDCDVIVSEVRETSRKPDEVYDLIERLSPGGRKVELFARAHNRKYTWLSLGNQLPGSYIVEEDLIERFNTKYPDKKLDKETMKQNLIKSTTEIEI